MKNKIKEEIRKAKLLTDFYNAIKGINFEDYRKIDMSTPNTSIKAEVKKHE